MSMDEVFDQMKYFHETLVEFNGNLRASMEDLTQHHNYVAPHWQDEMRREYDREWHPLEELMHNYTEREGPCYVRFLEAKLDNLYRYLYG